MKTVPIIIKKGVNKKMDTNIENRIICSEEQMMISLTSALDQMRILLYDGQFRRYLGDDFADKVSEWETNIRQRKEDPYTIVVVGDFNRGKSTLINALLGEEVVTSNVTPETVTMNRISYGTHSNEAVLSDYRHVFLSDRELRREALEQVLGDIGQPVEILELKRPCEFLKKICIIDTPGLGDSMQDFKSIVRESLFRADAVLYVYSVNYPLSLSEQIFLKSTVIPLRHTALFLVGNYTDTLESKENYIRMREFLQQRINGMFPDTEIFMVSALDELCLALDKKRPSSEELRGILEQQFNMLRESVYGLVAQKADTIVLDRMQRLTSAMIEDLSACLDTIDKGLSMSHTEAEDALKKLSDDKEEGLRRQIRLVEETDDIIRSMKDEAQIWLNEFVERVSEESLNLSEQSGDTLRQYYEFYCIDLMQEAITLCVEYHQEQLYDYLDEISSQLSGKLAESLEELPPFRFRFHLDNRIWTKGDTVGLAVSMFPAYGFLSTVASLVADGISGTFRQKESAINTPEIIMQIKGKMTGLSVSINNVVDQIYASMGENCKKLIIQFYKDELESKELLLNNAIVVSEREESEKMETRTVLAQARQILNNVERKSGIKAPVVS